MSKTTYEIVYKAVAWFVLADQVRRAATDAEDARLAENIARHGVLQPLGARIDGRLVWGFRRLRCAIAAGLTEVPVVVLGGDMTEAEFLTLNVVENVQRADLKPFDLWAGCVRLLEANPGWQLKDLAAALSFDPSYVTRIMAPSRLGPAWRDALAAGAVTLADCYAAAKRPEAEHADMLSLALTGATRDALESAGRAAAKTGRTPPPARGTGAARVKCQLPSGYTVVVSGGAVTLDEAVDALAEASREMKRARDLGYTARTFAAAMSDRSRKG